MTVFAVCSASLFVHILKLISRCWCKAVSLENTRVSCDCEVGERSSEYIQIRNHYNCRFIAAIEIHATVPTGRPRILDILWVLRQDPFYCNLLPPRSQYSLLDQERLKRPRTTGQGETKYDMYSNFDMSTVVCLLLTLMFSYCHSCMYNSSHCACSPRTIVSGTTTCYDFVADIEDSPQKVCTSRDCKDGYVCECNGTSYCSHSNTEMKILQAAEDGKCDVVSKRVHLVTLETLGFVDVSPRLPSNNNICVLDNTQCTCASTTEIGIYQDCYDFLYTDAVKGDVCRVRDCKESMRCDCAGSNLCYRTPRNITTLRRVGSEGRPGYALCEWYQSVSYVLTLKESWNC